MTILCPVDPMKWQISQWYGKPQSQQTAKWYEELGLFDESGEPTHNGIDFACPEGTPIIASHNGIVESYISNDGALIIWVINEELKIKTVNIHLSEFTKVAGNKVKVGEIIGYSGNSGRYTTGAHLHFGVYPINKNGDLTYKFCEGAVDPVPYLAKKFINGTLVKTISEPKVYWIQNDTKWWIKDENTFEKWCGYKVNKAKITEIDLITYNYYRAGEIRYII